MSTDNTNTTTSAPKKRGRKPGQTGKCSYCGKPGHYITACRKRKADEAALAAMPGTPDAE